MSLTLVLVLALCVLLTAFVVLLPLWVAGLLQSREEPHSDAESDTISGPSYIR